MSTVIENADRRVNEASESLRRAEERLNRAEERLNRAEERLNRAEEELREWKAATQPFNTTHPTYVELKAEVTRCTAVLAGAQQTFAGAQQTFAGAQQTLVELSKVELSKQNTLQLIAERDLLLQRSPTLATMFPLSSPSTHPSEHTLTPNQMAARRKTRAAEKLLKKQENAQWKSETIQFYYGQPRMSTIKDMLTNFDFPVHDVHRSHIFQASWDEGKFTQLVLAGGLEFADVTKDSPENMLLLHDNVETKYDCGQLLIEYEESSQNFICRILDKRIASELIFLNPQSPTFRDYDGKPLYFPSDSRPLRRLIRFRAIVNRLVAIERGYIGPQEYEYLMDSDDWSPGTKALFESIIDWNSNIPRDSHLYVNTALLPE
jgi:hypothetical protein